MAANDTLNLFHPLIKEWFLSKYKNPTDIQEKGWREISSGSHILMTAPTGSGKTLASFLWSINQLICGEWPGGTVRVLYISPLKALNNDVKRNLLGPLGELKSFFLERGVDFPDINVLTRSGDTSSSDRQKMVRKPPEILITTPESLNLMLTSGAAQKILSGIAAVILDEIHAVAANKRGVHLISAIERLTLCCGEFQRIGLSATVHPISLVSSLLGGAFVRKHIEETQKTRAVKIIKSNIMKKYEVVIEFPEKGEGETSQWPSVIEEFVNKIKSNRSTLIFCNSRRQTEKVTRLINEYADETIAFAHHGSLSREIRFFIEQKMKNGELKAIVATSSLEMGIDIGTIDEVLLIQAPFSVSSAVQRIGRGGHNVGDVSRSTFFPMFGTDLLCCAVTARSVIDGEIEELKVPVNPLDVLAQVILSMCCTKEWIIEELYLFITSVFHWRNLPRKHFDLVIEMLNGRYSDSRIGELKSRLTVDRVEGMVKARDGAQLVIYLSGGTIPDRGYYELRVSGSGARIGELDEEFVWERSHGDFFTLGTQTWRVDNITDRAMEVSPANTGGAMSPFWKADPNGRDFFYSKKILDLLESIETKLSPSGKDGEAKCILDLTSSFCMEKNAAEALIAFLKRQRKHTESPLPHRNHLLIEHFNDPLNRTDCHQVILHTLWGGKMNFPFSEAISQGWEDKHGYPLQVFCDDDAIILDLPHQFSAQDIFSLVNADNLEKLIRRRLESTIFFGGRFRHNCSRALLLPRKSFKQRTPLWLTRLRSKKLLQAVSRYEDFPILTETWRSCLNDDFDLDSLINVLDEIREGGIKITETVTKSPSPFSAGIIYDHTNQRMYEDDTPLGGKSNLREDLIKGIIHESGLRPMLSEELVEEFSCKIQRTYPFYSPRNKDDLFDWVDERIFIPLEQWEEMKQSIARDSEDDIKKMIGDVEKKLLFWETELSSETLVISKNYRKKYSDREFLENLDILLPQWIGYFEPKSVDYLTSVFPAPENDILNCLESLRESEYVIIDKLTENAETDQFCTSENLEILIRLKRRKGKSDFKALPIEKLQNFLAQYQLLTRAGTGKDDLQQVFEKMIALGIKSPLWETDIFPSRINPYYKSWLDTMFQENPLVWYGCGKEKIAFCFEEEQSIFISKSGDPADVEELLPDKRGSFNFWDLKEQSGKSSSELVSAIWKQCWNGQISNDHFSTIRTGIMNKFSADNFRDMEKKTGGRRINRGGYNRWMNSRPVEGRWFITDSVPSDEDLLEKDERIREVIRQLFLRYGVLFRELLEKEAKQMQWPAVFRTLRLMELSGECVSGNFFKEIRGIQFASWEALRDLSQPLDDESIYWMNCTDPASLSGLKVDALRGRYPARIASNHMVFKGDKRILFSRRNGKELEFFTDIKDPVNLESLGFFKILLSREFKPLKSIKVETVNGQVVSESPYGEILKKAGFRDNFSCYILSGMIV